jgi:hypothetical protein
MGTIEVVPGKKSGRLSVEGPPRSLLEGRARHPSVRSGAPSRRSVENTHLRSLSGRRCFRGAPKRALHRAMARRNGWNGRQGHCDKVYVRCLATRVGLSALGTGRPWRRSRMSPSGPCTSSDGRRDVGSWRQTGSWSNSLLSDALIIEFCWPRPPKEDNMPLTCEDLNPTRSARLVRRVSPHHCRVERKKRCRRRPPVPKRVPLGLHPQVPGCRNA